MTRVCACQLTLFALAVVPLPVFGAPNGQAVRPYDLRRDRRLARELQVEAPRIRIGQALQEIHRQCGVDLVAQSEILRHPAVVDAGGRQAVQILQDVAGFFGGVWTEREGAYLLITDEVRLGLLLEPPPTRSGRDTAQEHERLLALEREFVSTLTPSQRQAIALRHRLEWEELTPAQQAACRVFLTRAFLEHRDRFPSSIVRGARVFVGGVNQVEGEHLRVVARGYRLCAWRLGPDHRFTAGTVYTFSELMPVGQ